MAKVFANALALSAHVFSCKQDVFTPDTPLEEQQEQSVKPVQLERATLTRLGQSFSPEEEAEIRFFLTSAESAKVARDLVNVRGSEGTPDFMEREILALIEKNPLVSEHRILRGDDLLRENMNLFHAVGRAADSEPRMIVALHKGRKDSDEVDYAFVGKGITYDTGGLNLKPSGYMEDMNMDKAGACSVAGALFGAGALGLEKNVVFAFGLAENAIDSRSYKGGDILTSRKGITVEIGNTDAEGRLVLADTMTYVQQNFQPKRMVDIATLTGAIMVALGVDTAGLFYNDEALADEIRSSG